ncbi:nucleic acid/nucleotide deaminase domain-containing protein [Streptomyces sp. Q6]|uniref:Nucleic acid/nucleotide deaminase domain-containing protein n=1 Tax=Streptomyces citrinus TaxID=3118173 RepID=A0ACD5A6V4_9ACTN
MGYTIPGWLDDVLDFIGINFPNVDEDDYREMATAMRDFADKFEGHGGDAHKAFSRILSSSEGWAVDSMEKHWSQVKASHLDKLPELARLFADACDVLADIIFGMKTKAEVELAVMAGSVGISAGLAVVTGGLSALIGAAEVAAMRQLVKRIIDEAVDRIVDEVLAKITEPINAKLEAMVEDMVLDLAEGAFSMQTGGGHGGKSGHGGMQLASASGVAGSGAKITHIDHFEFEDGAGKVSAHGSELHLNASTHLTKAKNAFGRSKGKDPFTQAFDSVLHGALNGSEKALKKVAKHVSETVPDRVKASSKVHKDKDHGVKDDVNKIETKKGLDAEQRTYLLNADGTIQRVHPDGTTGKLDDHDRLRLDGIVRPDGTYYIPKTDKEKADFHADSDHKSRVKSQKVSPYGYDLAEATHAARKARGDSKGTNYAAGRYFDAEGRESVLVGYSNKLGHSERMIGRPLIHGGLQDGLTEVFSSREPCQKNPVCARWLDFHFSDNLKVTHAADYYDATGKTTNKEHIAYVNNLKKILDL